MGSDLVNNAQRGKLAEYLVASALGLTNGIRIEWDTHDLTDHDDTKIEVKSAAYLRSWKQATYSKISFGIQPTVPWCEKTDQRIGDPCRQAEYYIFCLLHHKDKATLDPLNLDQWTFYVLPTAVMDEKLGGQKTITLSSLEYLEPVKCNFSGLRGALDNCKPEVPSKT